jgi:hypothetical protein
MATNSQCRRTIDAASRPLKLGHITRAQHDTMVSRARNDMQRNAKRGGGHMRGLTDPYGQRYARPGSLNGGGYNAGHDEDHDEEGWHGEAGWRNQPAIGHRHARPASPVFPGGLDAAIAGTGQTLAQNAAPSTAGGYDPEPPSTAPGQLRGLSQTPATPVISLPRNGSRVGPHIVLFEACSAFTRVATCTLALSPIRDSLIEGFSHFVASMTAPIASGWSGCRVGLAATGKRRLCTAHAKSGCSYVKRPEACL